MRKGESDRRQAINRASIFKAAGEIGSTMNYGFQGRTPAHRARTLSSDKGACISHGCQAMRCDGDFPSAVPDKRESLTFEGVPRGGLVKGPSLSCLLRLRDNVHRVESMSSANGLLSNAARLQKLEQEYCRVN